MDGMDIHALVPFIATVLFIPLIVILLFNHSWQLRQKLLFLYLLSALCWSLADFVGRSRLPGVDVVLMVRLVGCFGIWMGIQVHYFLLPYYQTKDIKYPLAYPPLVGSIVLAVLGYMPQTVQATPTVITVNYGIWFILIAFLLIILVGRDVYFLRRRYGISVNPMERNQIAYLLAGVVITIVLITISFTPASGGFPVAHLGNLLMGCILTYSVITHNLVDIGVAFRRVLRGFILGVAIVAICCVSLFTLHSALSLELNLTIAGIVIGITIISTLLIYQLRGITSYRIDKIFTGGKNVHRKQLLRYISEIHEVTNLEAFGTQFVSLLCRSLDSQRVCLLLPLTSGGDFITHFSYPQKHETGNPASPLSLRQDSPILVWLRREARMLSQRNIDILPEFTATWQMEKESMRLANIEMLFPIVNEDRLVAVLALGSKRENELYSVEDIRFIESVTKRVAGGLEKEYLHEQLMESEEELISINRLVAIITSSTDINEIFEGFSRELKTVMEVDWAIIALRQGNELYFSALSSTLPSAWQIREKMAVQGTGTEWVLKEQRSLYEPDLLQYHRFWTGKIHLKQGIRSIIYLPLIVESEGVGSLTIASRHPQAYSAGKIRLLEQLALYIAAPIRNSQLYTYSKEREFVDDLTGIFNRRYFDKRLKEEVARHAQYGGDFSLLMLDLDSFKIYNDIYGHPSGDELLKQVGSIIRDSIRTTDQAFRYGGDEFIIILPRTGTEDAYHVGERVRHEIALEMKEKSTGVTCSIGLASYPTDGTMPSDLVAAADVALYYVKHAGGNQTHPFSSALPTMPLDHIKTTPRDTYWSIIYALISAVDAKDHYTYKHSRTVKDYAVTLAEAISLSSDEIAQISAAALLHDVGKIGIPDDILNKKGELTTEEWEKIKEHPQLGATIVASVPSLVPCTRAILHHHEHYDGTGYPDGLKGEAIPVRSSHPGYC